LLRASDFDGIDIVQGFQFFLKGLPQTANPVSLSFAFDE